MQRTRKLSTAAQARVAELGLVLHRPDPPRKRFMKLVQETTVAVRAIRPRGATPTPRVVQDACAGGEKYGAASGFDRLLTSVGHMRDSIPDDQLAAFDEYFLGGYGEATNERIIEEIRASNQRREAAKRGESA